jgi:hypothetical protein
MELCDGLARGGSLGYCIDGGPRDYGPGAAIAGATRGGARSGAQKSAGDAG